MYDSTTEKKNRKRISRGHTRHANAHTIQKAADTCHLHIYCTLCLLQNGKQETIEVVQPGGNLG